MSFVLHLACPAASSFAILHKATAKKKGIPEKAAAILSSRSSDERCCAQIEPWRVQDRRAVAFSSGNYPKPREFFSSSLSGLGMGIFPVSIRLGRSSPRST